MANFTATDERQAAAVEKLKQYAADCWTRIASGQNVVLFGVSGTGKDHLITGLVHEIIKRFTATKAAKFAWQSGPGLFAEMRAAIGNDSQVDPVKKYIEVSVLVLSDLIPPSGKLTDWQADTTYRLVDSRYNHLRPIFATINVKNRTHMEEMLGVAVADRLRDGALAIPCDWASHREVAK